jgi:large subunit ribosomal protein L28
MLTGRSRNKANTVTFSNKKWRKWQDLNSQSKNVFWPAGQRYVKLRISTRTIKTIDKVGLSTMAMHAKINLWKLPFKDARPLRLEFLRTKSLHVPRPKSRKNNMKNPVRLAASQKKPMVPRYVCGRIFWIRDGEEEDIYKLIQSRLCLIWGVWILSCCCITVPFKNVSWVAM